jgi:hypothetical protein
MECLGGRLVDELGHRVAVHRIDRVLLVQRQVLRHAQAVGEDDAVGRLARCEHDLADAELRGGVQHVIGAHHVDAEDLVVGADHDAGNRGEVDDGVHPWRA